MSNLSVGYHMEDSTAVKNVKFSDWYNLEIGNIEESNNLTIFISSKYQAKLLIEALNEIIKSENLPE